MNQDQITGIVRAVTPAIVAWLAGRGILLADATVADLLMVLVTGAAVLWTIYIHKPTRQIAVVASMDATRVSPDGKTITLLKPELVEAAKNSATPPKN